jgi:sensor histidine kinase regulating citrate/malate metabolism
MSDEGVGFLLVRQIYNRVKTRYEYTDENTNGKTVGSDIPWDNIKFGSSDEIDNINLCGQ